MWRRCGDARTLRDDERFLAQWRRWRRTGGAGGPPGLRKVSGGSARRTLGKGVMVDTVAARGEREARMGQREVGNGRAGKRTES